MVTAAISSGSFSFADVLLVVTGSAFLRRVLRLRPLRRQRNGVRGRRCNGVRLNGMRLHGAADAPRPLRSCPRQQAGDLQHLLVFLLLLDPVVLFFFSFFRVLRVTGVGVLPRRRVLGSASSVADDAHCRRRRLGDAGAIDDREGEEREGCGEGGKGGRRAAGCGEGEMEREGEGRRRLVREWARED